MTRVTQRKKFLFGKIGIRLLVIDTPTRRISTAERDRIIALTLDAGRLLNKLGRDWARSRSPQVTHEICRFAIDWQSVVTATPLVPALPLTGNVDVDIAARDLVWLPAALAALGLPVPVTVDTSRFYDAIADDSDLLFDRPFMGRLADVVTLVVTTLPTGWHAWAQPDQGVAVVQYDDAKAQHTSVDRVIAHEIAHLFGALDEYSDHLHGKVCDRNSLGGILQVPNANCVEGAVSTVQCLMLANQPVLCGSTPLHLGWEDRDGSGALDLAEPPTDHRACRRRTLEHSHGSSTSRDRAPATPPAWSSTAPIRRRTRSSSLCTAVIADIPGHISGPVTVEVTTPAGWAAGDPGSVVVIV